MNTRFTTGNEVVGLPAPPRQPDGAHLSASLITLS